MATLLAHIRVHPGREAEFEDVAREMHARTHADEPGCRRYEYWRGKTPYQYYCLLAFDDYHAFLRHQASEHHEAAAPRFGELIAEIRLEWLDPVYGASGLAQTDPQALPEGAAEAIQRAARWFGVETQPWWRDLRED
ncbi:MAG: antibiotic biosynthesis monooxygenase family protein [Myxococcota bacterium]